MARVKWNTTSIKYIDSMWSNTSDWQAIRKSPDLIDLFAATGESLVRELNWELHAAQARRKQKVEDGYKFAISYDHDRIRMRIWAFTARAAAHEAKHQSILKSMKFVGDVRKRGGRATNPNAGAGGSSGGRARGNTGGTGTKRPGGGGSRGRGRQGPKSENKLVNKRNNEARLRRRLMGLDALAHPKSGATEDERKLAAEKARRIRDRLGE